MGSWSSNRWVSSYRRRDLVEDCFCLSITALSRRGLDENFKFEGDYSGDWFGTVHRLDLGIYPDGVGGLVMDLNILTGGTEPLMIDQRVEMHSTPVFDGKHSRWWLECPMEKEEDEGGFSPICSNRCAVLYLPPGAKKFGCRACKGLSYRKNQSHDKRLDWLRKNPLKKRDALMNLVESQAKDPDHEEFVKRLWALRLPGVMKPQNPGSGGSQANFKK
jgi:hypothetical protein